MFRFNDFLRCHELDPSRTRLLRHDRLGEAAWRRSQKVAFGCFASFQNRVRSPYAGKVELACHFLPGPTLDGGVATALFVGTTRILDRWDWNDERMPRLFDEQVVATERGKPNVEALDLEWVDAGDGYAERILVSWGAGTRAWSQWASRNDKEILELRLTALELPFPGFSDFIAKISDIPIFPQAWISALESVRGVYLLVSENGEQYVGSATGADGFLGRWRAYLANGHGGNIRLRDRSHRDYTVSILEVASPDMAPNDTLVREAFWKNKLGARAHGLNAN